MIPWSFGAWGRIRSRAVSSLREAPGENSSSNTRLSVGLRPSQLPTTRSRSYRNRLARSRRAAYFLVVLPALDADRAHRRNVATEVPRQTRFRRPTGFQRSTDHIVQAVNVLSCWGDERDSNDFRPARPRLRVGCRASAQARAALPCCERFDYDKERALRAAAAEIRRSAPKIPRREREAVAASRRRHDPRFR